MNPARSLVPWLPLIDYCAEECRRQRSGELSVSWMLQAWTLGLDHSGPITERLVLALGAAIEPVKNANGYRRVGVRVGWDVKMRPEEVPDAMARLVEHAPVIPCNAGTAGDWYRQYEEVHPFVDGNGRTGKVLYNLLMGTLLTPEIPPDFFGGGIP